MTNIIRRSVLVSLVLGAAALMTPAGARAAGATYYLYDAGGNRVAAIDGSSLAPPSVARATVNIAAGSPGAVSFAGTPSGISWVAIQTINVPGGAIRVVRFTFSAAMPDLNYVVMATRSTQPMVYIGSTALVPIVLTRTTTYFDVGLAQTAANSWYPVDAVANEFAVLAYR